MASPMRSSCCLSAHRMRRMLRSKRDEPAAGGPSHALGTLQRAVTVLRRGRARRPIQTSIEERSARLAGSGTALGVTVSVCNNTSAPLVVVLSATKNRKLLVGVMDTLPPALVASVSFAPRAVPAALPAKIPSISPSVAESALIVNEPNDENRPE